MTKAKWAALWLFPAAVAIAVSVILMAGDKGDESGDGAGEEKATHFIREGQIPLDPRFGWTFDEGSPGETGTVSREFDGNEIALLIPPLAEGEFVGRYHLDCRPRKSGIYHVRVEATCNQITRKEGMVVGQANRLNFRSFSKGKQLYEFLAEVKLKDGPITIDLVAGRAEGARAEPLELKFHSISYALQETEGGKEDNSAAEQIAAGAPNEYEVYLDASRREGKLELDYRMEEFRPTGLAQQYSRAFSLDDSPWREGAASESAEGVSTVDETPLVRPAPYPFFTSYAVPSDACATDYVSAFLNQNSLSRDFGLDLTTSFFPLSDWTERNEILAIFNGGGTQPMGLPIRLENQIYDREMLFLLMYHRGWIDHIHSFSNGALSSESLVEPCVLKPGAEIVVDLGRTAMKGSGAFGIEVKVHPANFEGSIDFEYTDGDGKLETGELMSGSGGGGGGTSGGNDTSYHVPIHIKGSESGRLRITRAAGRSDIEITSITPVSAMSADVAEMIRYMKGVNIFPIASTWHGGVSGWHSRLRRPEGSVYGDDRGAYPDSPTHVSKLLDAWGVEYILGFHAGIVSGNQYPTKYPDGGRLEWDAEFGQLLTVYNQPDGRSNYLVATVNYGSTLIPDGLAYAGWCDTLPHQIYYYLGREKRFGNVERHYMHFNIWGPKSFEPSVIGWGGSGYQFHPEVFSESLSSIRRHHPDLEKAFSYLADSYYDFGGQRDYRQRVWCVPISVLLRYELARKELSDSAQLKGNTIEITSWHDEVMERDVGKAPWTNQDFHGQTFYLDEAAEATVLVDGKRIPTLKRNRADFTGRESVTIIDDSTPTKIFDEVDFFERNGRVMRNGASWYFQRREAYAGDYSGEVTLEGDGDGSVSWRPYLENNHETGYLRFAYRKSNPASRVWVGWSQEPEGRPEFVAGEGSGLDKGSQGWELPHFEDTEYHEVVVDYADLMRTDGERKMMPRGDVGEFFLGIRGGEKGDSITFDSVEFLSARGVRPHDDVGGLLIGGITKPAEDGLKVIARFGSETRETETGKGGWYSFSGLPKGSVVEIVLEKDGIPFHPERGRLLEVARNDLEYHISTGDPRSNSVARPEAIEGEKVPETMLPRGVSAPKELNERFGSVGAPHSSYFYAGLPGWDLQYVSEFQYNNNGFIDKDRRFENKDGSLRVLLFGECWTEGLQTPLCFHYSTILESMLRRKLGRNVEVITHATSNANLSTYAPQFEKYGRRFEPDILLLMSTRLSVNAMCPEIMEATLGWPREHCPYRTYDLDADGGLKIYEADPNYGAFAVPPTPAAEGEIDWNLLVCEADPMSALAAKTFAIFDKVLREVYIEEAKSFGGETVIVNGYMASLQYEKEHNGKMVSQDIFNERMEAITSAAGGRLMNLHPYLEEFGLEKFPLMTWEQDFHLGPTGHYMMARFLFDGLLESGLVQ